ncbi:uncharacterized protein LOC124265312 [Haliotis rubra]|uniref:uncharacterized protein LOC124265312 n=1 Tax=Haliotis rubra TaxID=36100 RepID=UPI001EE4F835|nr:uncharacterized protein LOC124265312 [Haliotis rubra]
MQDERYEALELIGSGAYGDVYKGRKRGGSGEICALKYISSFRTKKEMNDVRNEILIMKKVNHPNIIKLLDSYDIPGYVRRAVLSTYAILFTFTRHVVLIRHIVHIYTPCLSTYAILSTFTRHIVHIYKPYCPHLHAILSTFTRHIVHIYTPCCPLYTMLLVNESLVSQLLKLCHPEIHARNAKANHNLQLQANSTNTPHIIKTFNIGSRHVVHKCMSCSPFYVGHVVDKFTPYCRQMHAILSYTRHTHRPK